MDWQEFTNYYATYLSGGLNFTTTGGSSCALGYSGYLCDTCDVGRYAYAWPTTRDEWKTSDNKVVKWAKFNPKFSHRQFYSVYVILLLFSRSIFPVPWPCSFCIIIIFLTLSFYLYVPCRTEIDFLSLSIPILMVHRTNSHLLLLLRQIWLSIIPSMLPIRFLDIPAQACALCKHSVLWIGISNQFITFPEIFKSYELNLYMIFTQIRSAFSSKLFLSNLSFHPLFPFSFCFSFSFI